MQTMSILSSELSRESLFPYGMQKLFGWFGGPGIKGSLEQLTARNIPEFIAWLIIIGQSFGSITLMSGF
jgi:putative oxidoreductase